MQEVLVLKTWRMKWWFYNKYCFMCLSHLYVNQFFSGGKQWLLSCLTYLLRIFGVILISCELVKLKNVGILVREILSYHLVIPLSPLHC
jgi:hypothetical protein